MKEPLKFTNHRIEEYALQVTYNPEENTGKIIYNLSLIKEDDLSFALAMLKDAHRTGLMVSDRIRVAEPGEDIGDYTVPDHAHAICTMCSITLDALLLQRGVPLNPIGGGVVEIDRHEPRRFISMLLYKDTTLDPLEVLISQDITSIRSVMKHGSGNILANMRECHMEAEPLVGTVLDELTASGFSGILDVGAPNVPLLGVPVSPQYLGVTMVGGTNAMAAIKEAGRWVVTRALKGLIDIDEMGYLDDY
ncbi:hypothetical protein ABH15_03220 [Methanoculleus taiwanensis]|uniref:NrpR regulatory domain-containing protein n=1 Tax=Methanoculleus taiwanensis TaxID=1550565 RepID=A0A498H626_9EURY|nr:DUF128 domain-containing protein [Methanoculleus taiwanensis]RXE57146.1 hypothetical protein ABH15_03220 [Methanoculleus taiwanensis]